MLLKQWVAKVAGTGAELIELRRYKSGIVARIFVKKIGVGLVIKMPDDIKLTFLESLAVGRGPMKNIRKYPGELVKRLPYFSMIKWYD